MRGRPPEPLHRGELHLLPIRHQSCRRITDDDLDRRERQAEHQSDREAASVVGVAAALEHPDRVHGRDRETGRHVGSNDHVRGHHRGRGVQHRGDRLHVDDAAVAHRREPGGRLHPRVRGHHEPRARHTTDRHRPSRGPMCPGREPIPTEQVDAKEDRLDEEGERLEGEREADHRAPAPHQPRPEEPKRERQHRARERPHRDEDPERPRPSPAQCHPHCVARPVGSVLREQEHRREADRERREDDVEPERHGHLCSGRLERRQRDDDHPGGDERTRTADPLLAKQVLYQLSYVP